MSAVPFIVLVEAALALELAHKALLKSNAVTDDECNGIFEAHRNLSAAVAELLPKQVEVTQ